MLKNINHQDNSYNIKTKLRKSNIDQQVLMEEDGENIEKWHNKNNIRYNNMN